MSVTERAVEQAKENLRLQQLRYGEGVGTATEVLDAVSLATTAEQNFLNARYDVTEARARLGFAVGQRSRRSLGRRRRHAQTRGQTMSEVPQAPLSAPPATPPMPPRRRRFIGFLVVGVLVVAVIVARDRYQRYNHTHIRTDDAYVEGTIYSVASRVPGTVARVNAAVNQRVRAGEVLVELDPGHRPREARGGRGRAAGRVAAGRRTRGPARRGGDQDRGCRSQSRPRPRLARGTRRGGGGPGSGRPVPHRAARAGAQRPHPRGEPLRQEGHPPGPLRAGADRRRERPGVAGCPRRN